MRIKSKPLAATLLCVLLLAIVLGIYLQILWTDWAIQRIFNKDFHNLHIFLALFTVELLTPKAIRGITTLILVLMTLYIFLIA